LKRVNEIIEQYYPHPNLPPSRRKEINPPSPGRGGTEGGVKNKPLFIVDASQSIPHFHVNVEEI